MLTGADILLVVSTTAVCTALVSALALLVLRINRNGSLASQLAVVVVATVAAITGSTIAIAGEMYVSPHDLSVLIWVALVSAAMSLAAALLIGRLGRRRIALLRDSARRVGDGGVVEADAGGWRELAELSAELADTSARLAAARAEVEQLDAARRQFFAWISHDLRTPLAGVRALAEALEAGVAADPAAYLRRLREQTDTMNRLVDDLFELSRLHTGALQLRRESVELLDIVSGAVADVRELALARRIRISHAGVAGQLLWADPHELTRVVVNLLANGIRHAPEGSEILVSADRDDRDRLILSVLDHGSGVAAEDLGRMFEVGWRASTTRSSDEPGSSGAGLGLAIVRGIVEAHGGDVRAAHVPDGFRLDVILPATA
ncbi:HAMP domain-containing sensor histidine kinase [Rathayibacter sp. VKM Ac-2760]|uniref:sensor histidine kinase n=1 Tax=Rathayibacter sp. VKM Ac-2760 TaxID=2609253 RepID=UPI001318F46F|nr:HAMP domain-containing sensor histidine kinase [Rathayibacter sp. VKM Ac-2760]QHC59570.1 two-component sensor histidine kinase [Rathayibacter sp. VKM Ac-2760]